MKVLVTGKNGFIGKLLTKMLTDVQIISVGRNELNLSDRNQVNTFFKQQTFDVVVHTAISGGSRVAVDGPEVAQNNLTMFYNLLSNKHKFGKLIQFGSGAEFDRFNGKDVNKSSQLNDSYPVDVYGMSKNIISRVCRDEPNCYTLRIFNVFGFGELPTRMISGNIVRYINKEDIVIIKNRLMDFFSIEDFVTLCKFYITNDNLPKDIDCCYSDKTTLLDIANMINKLGSHTVNINVMNEGLDLSYCGNSALINKLSIPLVGLQQGLVNLYNSILLQPNIS